MQDNPEIYDILDPNGGGKLVSLAKQAYFSKKPKLLDNYIKETIPSFLINDGEGDKLPIEKLVKFRNASRSKNRKFPAKIENTTVRKLANHYGYN